MVSQHRILLYEEYFNDKEILYKIEIYKTYNKQGFYVSFWKFVLLLLVIIFLAIVLIASLFLLTWRRPGLFSEDCTRRSCAHGFDLKCINSTCQCPSDDYYYTNKCLPKKFYGEFCHDSQEQCRKGLVCFNGKCSCNRTQFWDGLKCSDRVTYGKNCDFNECLDSLFLLCDASIKMCVCDSTRFWSGKACYRKRSNGEFCGSYDSACRNDKGLFCLNNYCTCNQDSTFYDNSLQICQPKKSYMEKCLNSQECSHTQGLYCSITNTCECLNSNLMYFDSSASICLMKSNETESCSVNIPCLGDMLCLNNNCQCSNETTQYFDSTQLKCLNRTLKGVSCSRNVTCRSDLGLSCVNGSCQCDSQTSYWSSIRSTCVQCPSGWTIFQDKCYLVYNNLDTWDDAQSMCESTGGNLVSIRTQADYNMVSGYYNQYTNYQELWVGARQNITYDFYWRDGYTKMNQTYPNSNWWCPTNPNNSPLGSPPGVTNIQQGCVRMEKWPIGCDDVSLMCTTDVCLNDWACNDQHAYLCERD